MNENGYIQMVDFGISKRMELGSTKVAKTFSVRGTPEYMAPEILKKKGYSYQVDWWALGTLIFEMLTG